MKEMESKLVMDAVIRENDEQIGVVQIQHERSGDIQKLLKQGGFDVKTAEKTEPDIYEMMQECEIDNPRPCELSITLGRLQQLGEEAGVNTDAINQLEKKGSTTEQEAQQAAQKIINELPENIRTEADMWYNAAWPSSGKD